MFAPRWAAGLGTAMIAAALAACGSTAGPAHTAASIPPAATAAPAAFNAADVAFTTGVLRLDGQTEAMVGPVAGHTTSTQLRQFAADLRGRDSAMRPLAVPAVTYSGDRACKS